MLLSLIACASFVGGTHSLRSLAKDCRQGISRGVWACVRLLELSWASLPVNKFFMFLVNLIRNFAIIKFKSDIPVLISANAVAATQEKILRTARVQVS